MSKLVLKYDNFNLKLDEKSKRFNRKKSGGIWSLGRKAEFGQKAAQNSPQGIDLPYCGGAWRQKAALQKGTPPRVADLQLKKKII